MKCGARLREKFGNRLKKPRIRLRQDYGVRGYADKTDDENDEIRMKNDEEQTPAKHAN